MWNHGAGAEVMQRIAAPMIVDMVSSALPTLIVIPVIYAVIKGFADRNTPFGRSVNGLARTCVMMPDMMGMMGGMGWMMGAVWLFLLVLVILGVAALGKYLFSKPRS